MARYEAHLTFDKIHGTEIAKLAESNPPWVFSQITGCPLLGPGTYCYLTGYDKQSPLTLLADMERLGTLCEAQGIPVLRSKIERIVFDSKTGVNEVSQRPTELMAGGYVCWRCKEGGLTLQTAASGQLRQLVGPTGTHVCKPDIATGDYLVRIR